LLERVRLIEAPGKLGGVELEVLGWRTDAASGETVVRCRLSDGSVGEIPDSGAVDGPAVARGAGAAGGRVRLASGVAVVAGAWRAVGKATAPARATCRAWCRQGLRRRTDGGAVVSGRGPLFSALDARVLRATDARYERSPAKIAELAGCAAGMGSRRCAGSVESSR